MKSRILCYGRVQGVGYRTLVMQIARINKIIGMARNLQSGEVEIFAEGEEKNLQKFIKEINVKNNGENPFSINAEKIEVFCEGDKNFNFPKKEFKEFEIDYGIQLDNFQKESLDRSEIGVYLLSNVITEVKGSREDIKDMHEDLKDGFREVKEETKGMREDMNMRFDELHATYGIFGNAVLSIDKRLDSMDNSLKIIAEKIGSNHRLKRGNGKKRIKKKSKR